ncbi:MAG: DUF5107 domain-containing protein, partial [Acidobacteriia bacterium]|nr:DUF5107 domain-containing protein [Terriglobia bacterium]
MPLIRILVLVFGFFGTTASAADPPVRVWLDSILLPAYPEGEAGTIPDFDAWTKEVANYPYPLLSNYGTKPQDHRWRSINLENEYLLCRVLPDLGGHLYSCRDKRNGREVFYANPVVKPAQVGLRGAFAAMGIESNFPFGHTRINTSPVDFALRTDPDGSAHAIVADIDRVTGMQWRVEFILQSGSSVLEQRVTLYNRSSARRPYYWWANAEIPLDDPGTRMVLPARVASTHTTPPEIIAWPAQVDGKDAAVVANNKAQAGWFAYGSREPFFAIYKPGSRSGLAHFADPKAVAGKKLWVWGHDGDAWVRKELTDNFPSYVEMQAGVFQDQDTLNFLNPEQTNSFSESWIPIFDLGGVSRVTSDAILNLDRSANHGKGPGLVLELSATHAIRGAAIRVLSEGKVVFNTTADLTPAAIYSHVLESPSASPYTVELADSQNRILLRHTENTYDTVAPEKAPLGKVPDPLPKADSEEHDLARGDFYVLHHLPALAWNEYSNGLRRYPRSLPIRKAAGQLALSLSRFDEAANLLRVAAGADDQAIYALGAAEALAGHDADGYRELARIRPDSAAAAAASLQLSKIAARARNTAAALAALHPLLTGVAHSTRAGALEVALLRRSGQTEPARKALERWQTLDPSDSMLRFESTLLGRKDDELWSHLALDSERVLNLVDEYLSLGMETDALLLLDHPYPSISGAAVEPGAVPVALSPMIAYYRAFCRSRLHQDPFPDLRAATAGFTHYLFPNRASSFAVLTTATRLNPSDALAHLLLGRLLLNSLLGDQAIAEFRRALQLNPKLPETHYDLARTLIDVQKNPA